MSMIPLSSCAEWVCSRLLSLASPLHVGLRTVLNVWSGRISVSALWGMTKDLDEAQGTVISGAHGAPVLSLEASLSFHLPTAGKWETHGSPEREIRMWTFLWQKEASQRRSFNVAMEYNLIYLPQSCDSWTARFPVASVLTQMSRKLSICHLELQVKKHLCLFKEWCCSWTIFSHGGPGGVCLSRTLNATQKVAEQPST